MPLRPLLLGCVHHAASHQGSGPGPGGWSGPAPGVTAAGLRSVPGPHCGPEPALPQPLAPAQEPSQATGRALPQKASSRVGAGSTPCSGESLETSREGPAGASGSSGLGAGRSDPCVGGCPVTAPSPLKPHGLLPAVQSLKGHRTGLSRAPSACDWCHLRVLASFTSQGARVPPGLGESSHPASSQDPHGKATRADASRGTAANGQGPQSRDPRCK